MTMDRGTTKAVVSRLSYKPGWTFKVAGPFNRYLCVMALTDDSRNPTVQRHTQHMFEMPDLDGRDFIRWVFDCLLLCEQHEAGEFFKVDGFAPFYPNHQDEGSPYARVERWEPQP
jgi:hypothetical protein